MNYLIDTNIISEIRKSARCDPNVAAWYESIDETAVYLSVLTLGEIRKGVERARPSDPSRARLLEDWLETVVRSFAERVLPVDRLVAEEWGRMSSRRPVSTIDALLVATAKVNRMTLATRNIADVADLGADLLNPFDRLK